MTESLKNHFLIAMPGMMDPNFAQTVTLICQHNEDGALGIVINRTVDLTVSDILQQMEIPNEECEQSSQIIHYGGPVQNERGFILHDEPSGWDTTLTIADDVGLTASRNILEAIANNTGPKRHLIALGYAGWGQGQLEREMSENAWLSGIADTELLFSTPVNQRWNEAAKRLGVDLTLLSREAGHA